MLSGGYPSFLRGLCEAYADLEEWCQDKLKSHPAVQRSLTEFWQDEPDSESLRLSGLEGHPLLMPAGVKTFDPANLTAREYALLHYFLAHAGQVCEKDDLIQAVWPEDILYTEGVRDDSLAQLVSRLRKKLDPHPGARRRIYTIPGTGYRFDGEDFQPLK